VVASLSVAPAEAAGAASGIRVEPEDRAALAWTARPAASAGPGRGADRWADETRSAPARRSVPAGARNRLASAAPAAPQAAKRQEPAHRQGRPGSAERKEQRTAGAWHQGRRGQPVTPAPAQGRAGRAPREQSQFGERNKPAGPHSCT